MTGDLAAFYAARLDEDEAHAQKDLWAVARSTAQGNWDALYGYNVPHSYIEAPADSRARIAEFTSHRASPPLADGEDDLHAADVLLTARMVRAAKSRAERALREVEAGRLLLAAWREAEPDRSAEPEPEYAYGYTDGLADGLLAAIKLRAAVYRDHPGYRQEWAP